MKNIKEMVTAVTAAPINTVVVLLASACVVLASFVIFDSSPRSQGMSHAFRRELGEIHENQPSLERTLSMPAEGQLETYAGFYR